MKRKLTIAALAIAGLASIAVPATAAAANDPQLTSEGKLVPTGTSVVGTAVQSILTSTTGAGLLSCATAKEIGEVVKNSGGTIEDEIKTITYTGTGELGECTSPSGNADFTVTNTPLCVRSTPAMAEDEDQVGGDGCGTFGSVKFRVGSTAAGECKYETTSTVKEDFTTGEPQAQVTVRNTQAGSGAKLISGGFLCPTSVMLNMSYVLETTAGSSLIIS